MQWRRWNAKSSRNIKKMHLVLFSRGMGKEHVAVHKKCLQGKNDAIFGWLVGDLFGIWLVWGWFGWFVGDLWVVWLVCGWFCWFVGKLAGLWVVSSFTANVKIANLNWSLSYCLKLRYISFFGSKFSNFVSTIVSMMFITQTNFKEICRHKLKFRICN